MVKQTQNDILDMLIGSGSDLSEFLTPEGDVIGFSAYRPMDPTMDFLDDNIVDPLNVALCQDIQEIPEPSAEIEVEQLQFTFDPSETSIELLKLIASTSGTEDNMSPLDQISELNEYEEETEGDEVVSPLVKAEIKNRIRKRRQVEGKEELTELFVEPEPEQLTEEEEKKRIERREKNKLAAQKCRSKKRKVADCLEEETEKLEEKQERLKDEVRRLRDERDHLMELVKVHSSVCPKMKCSK
ncbi:basic leucine zipper (bZIP) transcription factor atfB-like isoform X2 [Pecten maximus]|nr:basic leucine zipper (bZIP) transcription factor atfB-like isoform X2 [Pecten maximus]